MPDMPQDQANLQLSLIEELPILHRLALSYAPSHARKPTLALLALDTRLAAILRAAREPMLAQLRLTWWREQLKADPSARPAGDPLLAALGAWDDRRDALVAVVDGWEGLTAPAPLPPEAMASLAEARGQAFGALAEMVGAAKVRAEAVGMGTDWGLADLAAHLGDPEERDRAQALVLARDWRRAGLPRAMRPLVVLHGLAARRVRDLAARRGHGGAEPKRTVELLAAMRLGLLGR